MKDSEYMFLLACIALAPHMSKGWGLFTWFVNMIGFAVLFYLEKFA